MIALYNNSFNNSKNNLLNNNLCFKNDNQVMDSYHRKDSVNIASIKAKTIITSNIIGLIAHAITVNFISGRKSAKIGAFFGAQALYLAYEYFKGSKNKD